MSLKDQDYLTIKEAATLLRCSVKTIHRQIYKGTIPITRPFGTYKLIPGEAVRNLLNNGDPQKFAERSSQ